MNVGLDLQRCIGAFNDFAQPTASSLPNGIPLSRCPVPRSHLTEPRTQNGRRRGRSSCVARPQLMLFGLLRVGAGLSRLEPRVDQVLRGLAAFGCFEDRCLQLVVTDRRLEFFDRALGLGLG